MIRSCMTVLFKRGGGGRDRKKGVGVDEIILLKRNLKKEDERMRTEFRSESIGEIL
jgi:hypothetical protein